MQAILIVFPNQLYASPYTGDLMADVSLDEIHLVEHPKFFNEPFCLHKRRVTFTRASCQWYHDKVLLPLAASINAKVRYVKYPDYLEYMKSVKNSTKTQVIMRDPCDKEITDEFLSLVTSRTGKANGSTVQVLESSPGFILTSTELNQLKLRGIHRNADVFKFVKEKMGILVGVPSYDSDNRKPLPASYDGAAVDQSRGEYTTKNIISSISRKFWKKATSELKGNLSDNAHAGTWSSLEPLPVTHVDAKAALNYFVKYQLGKFGEYQDAIHDAAVYLHHSNISALLNAGLITPQQVIDSIVPAITSSTHKSSLVPMASIEGFVRQVIGWREYMRYVYVTQHKNLSKIFQVSKTPKAKKSEELSGKWYTGDTGITPLDSEIKKATQTAYAHHIIRLMIFLNVFTLTLTPAPLIYRWFMEVVSLDAYEWVMWSNIAVMGNFLPGFSQKPYLSSSNYVIKMSNYKKGAWATVWDALFYHYLVTKAETGELMEGGARVYLRNLRYYEKQSEDYKDEIMKKARNFLRTLAL